MVAAGLPDLDALDREALVALVIETRQEVESHRKQQEEVQAAYVEACATLSGQREEIERLRLLIAKLRRRMFGTKSEKINGQIDQLELQLEEMETNQAAAEVIAGIRESDVITRPSRRPLPEHLPRVIVEHLPDQDCCPACGGELRHFGEDVAEVLEYIPQSFKVIRHVRPKFACRRCDSMVEAAAPTRPIARGLAGPGLLAHVLVSKYADHCPLYRQSEIYAREGVEIDRSTFPGWVGAASELLDPLVDAIRKHVLSATKLHADDTPVPVLAPGNGKTSIGRLWTYVRDNRSSGDTVAPAVWFAYSPDRKGEHPRQHLEHYRGALQADAYAGFHHLYEGGRIYEVACWAHARRKFHDIHAVHASAITTERSDASAHSMPSKKKCAVKMRAFVARCDRRELVHWSMTCSGGWKSLCVRSLPRAILRALFVTRSRTGVHSLAIWMMANSRSTIAPLSERFAPSRSDEKTISLQDPTRVVKVLLPSIRSLELPN